MWKDFAISIVETLRQRAFKAYLAGGCVRDLLLEREPADYDVATSATPAQVMEIFPESYAVGVQFGVVLVPEATEGEQQGPIRPLRHAQLLRADSHRRFAPVRNDIAEESPRVDEPVSTDTKSSRKCLVEVATFRSDLGYTDGRHPDAVRFSLDPREDVLRRDFTINGMMLDPLTDEVLDFVGGRKDLDAGLIRAIGDPERRFAEDKLRMLRAARFAARFEYEIEPETFAAIERHAAEIRMVSRERVRDELTRMLTEGHGRRAFTLLDETGLMQEVLPEISKMRGVEQPAEFHPEGDVFVHTLMALDYLPQPCSATLAWGTLLHDVGKPATFRRAPDRIRFDNHVEVGVKIAEGICKRLRFSRGETEQILALIDNHMRFGHVSRMKESTLKRFMRLPHFEEHLALHRADSLASHGILRTHDFLREKLTEMPAKEIRPRPLVNGDDLIAFGHKPGPKFREILETVENAQLEGRLASREAALDYVKREFPLPA